MPKGGKKRKRDGVQIETRLDRNGYYHRAEYSDESYRQRAETQRELIRETGRVARDSINPLGSMDEVAGNIAGKIAKAIVIASADRKQIER